jgi:hypothetical protein
MPGNVGQTETRELAESVEFNRQQLLRQVTVVLVAVVQQLDSCFNVHEIEEKESVI